MDILEGDMAERVSEIEPLYSEVEAARMLRIKPRTLRSERVAGRVRYRQVARRVMYRIDDLTAWQEGICRGGDPTKDRNSNSSRKKAGASQSGTSDGARPGAATSVQ